MFFIAEPCETGRDRRPDIRTRTALCGPSVERLRSTDAHGDVPAWMSVCGSPDRRALRQVNRHRNRTVARSCPHDRQATYTHGTIGDRDHGARRQPALDTRPNGPQQGGQRVTRVRIEAIVADAHCARGRSSPRGRTAGCSPASISLVAPGPTNPAWRSNAVGHVVPPAPREHPRVERGTPWVMSSSGRGHEDRHGSHARPPTAFAASSVKPGRSGWLRTFASVRFSLRSALHRQAFAMSSTRPIRRIAARTTSACSDPDPRVGLALPNRSPATLPLAAVRSTYRRREQLRDLRWRSTPGLRTIFAAPAASLVAGSSAAQRACARRRRRY